MAPKPILRGSTTAPPKEEKFVTYDKVASAQRLSTVAETLSASILSLDAQTEYGTTGRETTGGALMAALARALVGVEKELREAQKQALESAPQDSGKILMMAPEIPSKAPQSA
jgi:ribosomal protein S9